MASSAAESPPPMTANGLFLKMGTAPSHTAQALMPLCQYVCSPLRPRRLALAPVARMIVSALSGSASSWYSRQYLKGRRERSILDTVSVMMRVPNRNDCARNLSISSGPNTPLGKPGKFSTSVVVVSCPPAAKPFAMKPSKRTGFRFARAR